MQQFCTTKTKLYGATQRKFLFFVLLTFTLSMSLNVMAQDAEGAKPAAAQETVAASDLVSDIRAIREKNQEGIVDISFIIAKYFPKGMDKQAVLDLLKAADFKVSFYPPTHTNPVENLYAVRSATIGKDEIQIGIGLVKDHVVGASGKLVYQTL